MRMVSNRHRQQSLDAPSMFLLIAGWYSRAWGWLLAMVLIFLMALSRIYLGDHFISDVIAGLLLGLLLLTGYLSLM